MGHSVAHIISTVAGRIVFVSVAQQETSKALRQLSVHDITCHHPLYVMDSGMSSPTCISFVYQEVECHRPIDYISIIYIYIKYIIYIYIFFIQTFI